MSSFGSKFDIGEVEAEEGHNNSSNGSKGSIATKEFLKRRCGKRLPCLQPSLQRKNIHIISNSHTDDYVMNLLLLISVPM
jgi:hypothetical protein